VETEKRRLTSGLSLWLDRRKQSKLSVGKALPRIRSEIIVVGTGISGALAADALLSAGFSVLAVDRRNVMTGSTSASTALLEFEIDNPLINLEKKIGKSMAARAWWRSAQSVQALSDRIRDLGIDCDFFPRSSLYLPGDVLGVRDLKREAAARQNLGLRSTFVDRAELEKLSGIQAAGAILSKGNGEVNPVRLVEGIWKNFLKNGGDIVENVEITEVDQTRSFVRLETSEGHAIAAKYAVFCTGYEVLKCAKPRNYKVVSTWVLGTRRQPDKLWRSKSLIWEAADPYLYMRTTPDGRILAGGEDEPFSSAELRDKMLPKKIAAIAKGAKKIWPHANFEADYAWTGSFGDSPTGLPAIGPIKGLPRCYAVLGFGGNGISYSMLAAQLVSRHIQGIKDPDAGLFAL
jgi:glycine/D-amino acid oxidase-like deaminating enzyme